MMIPRLNFVPVRFGGKKLRLSVLGFGLVWAGLPSGAKYLAADVSFPFIEYRDLKPLGQIRLTRGVVHDPNIQTTILGNLGSFDRQGIVLMGGNSERQFHRTERIGSHTIETTISVHPALGHGYRGGLATADVLVTIDGIKRIDCPFDRGPTELNDVEILPSDGMIQILGSEDGREVNSVMFLKGNRAINADWLATNAK
jgi:hypothetical protein